MCVGRSSRRDAACGVVRGDVAPQAAGELPEKRSYIDPRDVVVPGICLRRKGPGGRAQELPRKKTSR